MRIPRFSIRSITFAVFLVAVDCALVKPIISDGISSYGYGIVSALPMANILAIACYRNLRTMRPSFIAFALTGTISLVCMFSYCMTANVFRLIDIDNSINRTLSSIPFLHGIGYSINTSKPFSLLVFIENLVLIVFVISLPQFLLALFIGWLTRRFTADPPS